MQNIIIGTAGHIDHGKTTLIRALTGRSTDKLQEEIKRGISINLGFTYFDLPNGKRAGIVDVPGHERFIKNMLAGATGIDIVLLAIAANEGVKPQTIEHVDILSYLDIKDRIIVLTKCGVTDEVMRELVKDDIREQLAGTFFDGAEIVEIDSISGQGLTELTEKLAALAEKVQTKNERAAARLHIDRVFSMKGFGTVVTGTLSEGTIAAGDELELYPKGLKAKIRSVQVHDESVERAYAGQRTALNISNVRREDVERGDVLAKPGTMEPTDRLDVKITMVRHTNWEIKLWERVRVYMGASEVLARVVPLDVDKLEKGESGYCQLRLEKTTVARKNDKFVIRTFSPLVTIGGGIVLDPNPKKHGKADKASLEALRVKDGGDIGILAEEFIKNNKEKYTTVRDVASYLKMDEPGAAEILDALTAEGALRCVNKYYFHADTIEAFNTACIEQLSNYHNKFPLRKGMLKEELKSKITKLKAREFDAFMKILEDEGVVRLIDNSYVALNEFKVAYSKKQEEMKRLIEGMLDKAGFAPPAVATYTNGTAKENMEVLETLIGVSVVRLDQNTLISKAYYDKARQMLLEHMKTHKEITLAEFRDMTKSSRKYAVLLLDEFDRIGLTMRVGDGRVLKTASPMEL